MLRTGPYLSPFYSLMFCVTSAHLAGKEGEKCGLRFLVINLEFRFTVTTRPELNVPEKESSNRGEMLTLSSQHVLLCLQAGAGRTLVLPVLHVLQSSGNRSSGQRGSDRQSFHWYFSLLLFFFLSHSSCPPHERKRGFLCLWSGGCGQEVSSELTLMKEDTSLYHLFQFLSHRVSVDQLLTLYK